MLGRAVAAGPSPRRLRGPHSEGRHLLPPAHSPTGFCFVFSLAHKLAGPGAPGSVKAEGTYLLLFFVPFSFLFMIVASDCVAETHKNWHKSREMCPRCCINREISLNAAKRLWFSICQLPKRLIRRLSFRLRAGHVARLRTPPARRWLRSESPHGPGQAGSRGRESPGPAQGPRVNSAGAGLSSWGPRGARTTDFQAEVRKSQGHACCLFPKPVLV